MPVLTTNQPIRFTVGDVTFTVHTTVDGRKVRWYFEAPPEVRWERVHEDRKAPIGPGYQQPRVRR